MIIISIDVGIKNLAYCLFNVEDKNNFEILNWDSIDLCNSLNKKCMAKCANNELCPNLAKYHINNEFYCKTHAKKVNDYFIPTTELLNFRNKNKKKNLAETYEFADKYNISYTKPCTKTKLFSIIDDFILNQCFKVINKEKTKDFSLVDLGKNMNSSFNNLFKDYDIDYVLIENQLSPIANRMKTIQGMIAQYFIMSGVNNIEFISSMNKLKLFVKSRKRTSYSERKKMSIDITKNIICLNKNILVWNDHFEKSKKKDDLADAFLQCIWFLLNNNEIILEIPPKI